MCEVMKVTIISANMTEDKKGLFDPDVRIQSPDYVLYN